MASSPLTTVVDLSALPAGATKFELIKRSVEAALEKKVPSALTVRERPAPVCLPSGVAELDALCGGGVIPRGALSEITGPASSGRTSLLHSLLAGATARQEFCALVDASGSFDPCSAQEAGVELDRVLWVCCRSTGLRVPSAEKPGSSRRSVLSTRYSELDNVLRVADLLITSGGFGLLALDLGDLEADVVRRVPLTTWFRFRRAVEHTPTAIVVVEQEAQAKSCAEVVLKLKSSDFRLQTSAGPSAVGHRPSAAAIFTGMNIAVELVRGQAQKKLTASARPTHFSTTAAWAG
jgi:hypothetical protein